MALIDEQARQVLRRLGRAPMFTVVTLLTLAIGIGANTVVFSVVTGVLLKPLNYSHPEQLIGMWHQAPGIDIPNLRMAPFLYFTDREQNRTLEDMGMYDDDALSITGSGEPERVRGLDVTDGTLPILGVKPALGRLFSRSDDMPNEPRTVLISYGYWQRKFGGNQSVIGRSITADGYTREIIGVLPRGFHFLDVPDPDVVVPMQIDRGKTRLGNFSFRAIGRLKPGVTLEQAKADLARLVPVAIQSFPAPDGFSPTLFQKAQLTPDLHSLKLDVIGTVGSVLWVLMGSIGIVLLVACANVANLLLVRVEGRRQELAIRAALGAGQGRITAGILMESLILGFAGSLIGLALAYGALRVLVAMAPTGLPRLHEIGIDAPVLLFTLGLALFVSIVIGLLPVMKYARVTLNTGLREGGRALSQSRERHKARKALVVVQVALALVLLICSGLMIRTFRAMMHVSPGFSDPSTLQTFRLYIPETEIPDTQRGRVVRTDEEVMDKLAGIPGVSSVAMGSTVPMDGRGSFDPVFAQDHIYKEGEIPPIRRFKFIAPGFFKTLGTPLVGGHDLTWTDVYEKRPVAIISESMANEYWRGPADALGKHIRVGNTDDWREVIGVAANTYDDGVNKPPSNAVYWPFLMQNYEGQKETVQRGMTFVIRSPRAGSAAFMREVQRIVWSVDGDLPLADPITVAELYTKSMARTSFTLVMLCVAGGMALLLGIVGIYGVISYAVSQRTREIGIRMALGAQRDALTGMFVRQGLMLTGIGVACGVVAAFGVMRLMSSLLFDVSTKDPWTYAAAIVGVVLISWIACYLPSRRAAAVNPVNALRAE